MLKRIFGVLPVVLAFASCAYDPGNNDMSIINNTPDSLYYYVHPYNSGEYKWNIAYLPTANDFNKYEIDYNSNYHRLPAHDTIHPTINARSWKDWAEAYGGLTLRFYKRDIEQKPVNERLDDADVFKRIDLTLEQLDSLHYIINLK